MFWMAIWHQVSKLKSYHTKTSISSLLVYWLPSLVMYWLSILFIFIDIWARVIQEYLCNSYRNIIQEFALISIIHVPTHSSILSLSSIIISIFQEGYKISSRNIISTFQIHIMRATSSYPISNRTSGNSSFFEFIL